MITKYVTDGEEPGVLYAMIEEDVKRLKHFYPNVFCVELAMNAKAKDLIEGITMMRGLNLRTGKAESETKQRLVKIKIESVEYVGNYDQENR
tara:strand:+ start:429 stop:704 length:276 start_codon:yes stop_codon:yes gene_type:complete